MHPPLGGSPTPSATATALQRRSTLPCSDAAGHAVAATARRRPRHALSNHSGRRFPRPRDRRLSRKSSAAVGKPPGSTSVVNAVRSADRPGANRLPGRQRENISTPLLLQTTRSWRSIDYSCWGWVDVSHDMMPRITRPDPAQTVWHAVGYGGNGVSFSTWAGKRLAERVAGKDAGQEVFKLPIYDSPLEYPNLFGLVRSPVFAPFRRIGQRILYKWYWLRDEK